jgi:hypothetical protein
MPPEPTLKEMNFENFQVNDKTRKGSLYYEPEPSKFTTALKAVVGGIALVGIGGIVSVILWAGRVDTASRDIPPRIETIEKSVAETQYRWTLHDSLYARDMKEQRGMLRALVRSQGARVLAIDTIN